MTKKEVFSDIQALTKNIVKLVQLRQKKFLETGDDSWLYGPNIHLEEMQDKYGKLIEEYKSLGGIVIGMEGLEDIDWNVE